jgi:hypothetical protein
MEFQRRGGLSGPAYRITVLGQDVNQYITQKD